MILLTISLIVVAAPSYAAQRPSLEKRCQDLVGKEDREGEGGRSHVGQLQVQRFSDCMMGAPHLCDRQVNLPAGQPRRYSLSE
jgi:hypothetical protein